MPEDKSHSGELWPLEELDHFIRLSQVQAEQLSRYQELQQRSHQIILRLNDQLERLKTLRSTSFRK